MEFEEVAEEFFSVIWFLSLACADGFDEGVEGFQIFKVVGVDGVKVGLAERAVGDEVDDFFGGVGEGFLAEFDEELRGGAEGWVFEHYFEPKFSFAVGFDGELPDFDAVELPKWEGEDCGEVGLFGGVGEEAEDFEDFFDEGFFEEVLLAFVIDRDVFLGEDFGHPF